MFGTKTVQSYDAALTLIEQGHAELLIHERYSGDPRPATWSDEDWAHYTEKRIPVEDRWQLRREVYDLFAPVAEKDLKPFVCGPFGDWDGSTGYCCDGAVFVHLRDPFMAALQHFRDDDGARYLFAFLTQWLYRLEIVPIGPVFGQDNAEDPA